MLPSLTADFLQQCTWACGDVVSRGKRAGGGRDAWGSLSGEKAPPAHPPSGKLARSQHGFSMQAIQGGVGRPLVLESLEGIWGRQSRQVVEREVGGQEALGLHVLGSVFSDAPAGPPGEQGD